MDLKKLAIVELHLHLDGALSSSIIIKIAKEKGIILPTFKEKELDTYLMVPKDCDSLNEYLKRFDIPNLVLQDEYGIKLATLDLLERLSKQGIRYAEIRMAPTLSTSKGLSQDKVVDILFRTLKEGKQLYNIDSNLILCMMRGFPHESNLETVEVANKYKDKGVVAIDLAGAEALFPNELYEEEFKLAKEYGLRVTIHAGEAGDYTSVWSAIKYGANRIGHGTHSYQDKKLMDYLRDNEIALEMCPTSNVDTKAVKSISEMPIKEYLEHGIKVTLSTDDPTVSNVTLLEEYENLAKIGYTYNDLLTIAKNTVKYSFASDEIKQSLLKSLE